MISMDKKYRTRDGREVRIYTTDGEMPRCVYGTYKSQTGWTFSCWEKDGVHLISTGNYDLIEVKPRIQRTVWLNVYEGITYGPYKTKCSADRMAGNGRFACIEIEIDCEEGEGL
jgi:hypothetical protein